MTTSTVDGRSAPADPSPEQTIRRYLDDHGGETDASVDHLLETFGVEEADADGRGRITTALFSAGVGIDRPLPLLGPNEGVHLFTTGTGDTQTQTPPPPAERRSPAVHPEPLFDGPWHRDGATGTQQTRSQPIETPLQPPTASPPETPGGAPPTGGTASGSGRPWWKRTWILVAGGVLAFLIVVGIIGALSAPDSSQESKSGPPPAKKLVELQTVSPAQGTTVRTRSVVVKGRVTPRDTVVVVEGDAVKAPGGRFRQRVPLSLGENTISVVAERPGFKSDEFSTTVTRKRSKQELAALQQRREQRRLAREERQRQANLAAEQRKTQARQNFIASAVTIPYNQLEKNADDFAGKDVTYRGQIFQIQEDAGASVILLSVTDEGYGLWTDNIWVDYPGEIQGAEDDIITIHGTVEGSESYETQIGGETYVPKITAKYIDE